MQHHEIVKGIEKMNDGELRDKVVSNSVKIAQVEIEQGRIHKAMTQGFDKIETMVNAVESSQGRITTLLITTLCGLVASMATFIIMSK